MTGLSLQAENPHVAYGNIRALRGLLLKVAPSAICTIVGANGAGKATTLNVICGLRTLTEGCILLDSVDVTDIPAHDLVPLGLVQVPEGRRVFARPTVCENLMMGAYRSPARGTELKRVLDLSRACANGSARSPARCPAASNRCSPLRVR